MRVKFLAQRKQREALMGFELTTDRHPPITSQARYPLFWLCRSLHKQWYNPLCVRPCIDYRMTNTGQHLIKWSHPIPINKRLSTDGIIVYPRVLCTVDWSEKFRFGVDTPTSERFPRVKSNYFTGSTFSTSVICEYYYAHQVNNNAVNCPDSLKNNNVTQISIVLLLFGENKSN